MCGIAGYAVVDHAVAPEILNSAERALLHRGPDDGGIVRLRLKSRGGEIGLANRRLAILDLSRGGHQPMTDSETGNWIAYNGEIFNYVEVRSALETEGIRFTNNTDTEVILKAYGRWGERCVDRFRGMFAFAIWDEVREQLFLARDRSGIKPLYYYCNGGDLYFASEVRALLATGLVPRKISRPGLMNYITFGSVCDPDTLIEGVFSVPPASYAVWKDGKLDFTEYWDLIGATRGNDIHLADVSDEELFTGVRSKLQEAFNLRMISDVPISIFLSGGIDSSALVALLAGTSPHPLHTFSIIFAEEDFSEAQYSRLIAERFQTDHHEILLRPSAFFKTVPEAIAAMDQPSLDGLNSYMISREVSAAGFKVALSGLGGDEVFAGYNLFHTVPKLEAIESYMKFMPQSARNLLGLAIRKLPGARTAHLKLASVVESGEFKLAPYVLARSVFAARQHKALVKSWTSESFHLANRAAQRWSDRARSLDPVNRISYMDMRNYMLNTLLRDADGMSMAHGIEVRVPFLDHKLMEFVFSIPGRRKLDRRLPKRMLTRSLAGLLPDEIVQRPKRGFTLPFEEWLRKDAYDDVNQTFCSWQKSVIAEYIDADAAREVWAAFLNKKTTWSRVWTLYVLQQWAQLYLGQTGQEFVYDVKDAERA